MNNIYLRDVSTLHEAQQELLALGVDHAGVGIMAKKMLMKTIFLKDLSVRAANILKQECIAVGADLALPKAASFLEGESTDAILMASSSQLEVLLMNLRPQPFGLKQLGEELTTVLRRARSGVERPQIMAVLNVTPDSFSQGDASLSAGDSLFEGDVVSKVKVEQAIERCIEEGADWIDIGAESTNPASQEVTLEEELRRLQPVFEVIAEKGYVKRVKFSIDTWKSEVADAAFRSGFLMLNDVTGLRGDERMAGVVARASEMNPEIRCTMMYAKDGTPRTTREPLQYSDVMETIVDFFTDRIAYVESAGIKREQMIIDPGMGAFVSGDPQYSFEVLSRLAELKVFGLPILVGTSRKSFIPGEVHERLEGSLVSATMAYLNGAEILRVHDVRSTKKALDVAWKIRAAGEL
jgi:dihydropteroate synthase